MTTWASATITQQIRSKIMQEKIAPEVQNWLEQTRKAGRIEIFNL